MIGVGLVDLKTTGAHDLVPRIAWRPFDKRHDSAGPCWLLFPENRVSM